MKLRKLKYILLFIIGFYCQTVFGQQQKAKLPEKVYVGVYLNDISGFDTKEGRFHADVFVWLKWLGSDSIPPITFSNAEIDKMEITSKESDNDWHSVRWRLQGTFRGNFPLEDFPFDEQTITLKIDMPIEWGQLIPDQAGSGMSPLFSITGWDYQRYFKVKRKSKTYASDLGSIDHEGVQQEASSIEFALKMDRPFAANFVKLIVPLFIILTMATLAFFLTSRQLVVRNSMVVTALLTCVAFHFSQAESLPDVSYLVAADKFFLWSYSLILLALIGVVVSHRFYKTNEKNSVKIDILFRFLIPVLALLGGFQITKKHKTAVYEDVASQIVKNRPIIHSSKDTLNKAVPVLPSLTDDNTHFLFMRGLYINGKNDEKIPHLVTKVPDMTNDFIRLLANGGITVKWHLRDDLKWGDGKPITIDDLIFSLNCVVDTNRKKITKIDDQTIEVEYSKRLNTVVDNFPIYPKDKFENVYKKGGLDSIRYVLGHNPPKLDGPYNLVRFTPNQEAVFKANPHFAGNKPRIPYIRIAVNKDGERWLSPREIMYSKRADLISLLSKNSYNSVDGLKSVDKRIDSLSNNIFFLQPDLSVPLFKNKEMRMAISYAMNRNYIINELDEGAGINTISSYFNQFHDIDYTYHPKLAKAIVENYSGDKKIVLMGYSRGKGAPEQIIIDIIIKNLNEVGFDVKFKKISSIKEAQELMHRGNHQGLLYYEGTKDDIGMFWNVPYDEKKGRFEMNVTHEEYDEKALSIYNKFQISLFKERRASLSRKLERLYAVKLPTIPIFSISYRSIYNEKLKMWDPMGTDMKNIWWNVEDLYFEK